MAAKSKLAVDTPEFWDEDALLREERRQFDVCHGCRLCWNFCPAFPALFERTDAVDGGMSQLTRQDLRPVEDLCYQCKLCFIRCPYTPPHRYEMDIPRLLLRADMINKRREGLKRSDRLLADTDRTFKLGSRAAPLANLANRAWPVRFVMEKTLGIHRDARLPRFRAQTFAAWFQRHGEALNRQTPAGAPKVALFYTCNANYWDPEAAIAAAQVLAHNGVRVLVPPQQCCGMPFLDAGAADLALKKARANVQSLAEVVRQGCDVVAPGPSCSLTIRKEYPHLLSTEDARLVAEHTFDVSEYLWRLKEKGALRTNFPNTVGKVAYHAACHLRAQFAGLRGADLIALIPGAQVERIERCSHHDGTWAIKKESRQLSLEYGEKLFQAMKDAEAHLFVSDCPLAATQIEDGTGRRPLHPMQVLKAAYGI